VRWWAMSGAVALLAFVTNACQSARETPKSEAEQRSLEFQSAAQGLSDRVHSGFAEVRERAAAGEVSAADRVKLSASFADVLKQQAPAVAAVAPPSDLSSAAPTPRAVTRVAAPLLPPLRKLEGSDAERFVRLKAAIERANAEVERHRPRSAP
jgi:hypothetical protein